MEIDRSAPVWAEQDVAIAAPIGVVWDVLTNVDDIPRWFSLGESVAIDGPSRRGRRSR